MVTFIILNSWCGVAPIRMDEGHIPGFGNGGLSVLSFNPLVAGPCGDLVWGLLGQPEAH